MSNEAITPKKGDFYSSHHDGKLTSVFVVKEDEGKYIVPLFGVETSTDLMNPFQYFDEVASEREDLGYLRENVQPSTPVEIKLFHDTLRSMGVRWDTETLQLRKIVPKPEPGQEYYFIRKILFDGGQPACQIEKKTWHGGEFCLNNYNQGLAFIEQSKALVLASKLRAAVNNVLKDYKP